MRRPSFDKFVAVALLLHSAGLAWLISQRPWSGSEVRPAADADQSGGTLHGVAGNKHGRAEDVVVDVSELSLELLTDGAATPRKSVQPLPLSNELARPQRALSIAAEASASRALLGAEATLEAEAAAAVSANGLDGAQGLPPSQGAAQGQAQAAALPSLSLRQLGIGEPSALVLAPLLQAPRTPEQQKQLEFERAEERLAVGLAQGLLEQDTQSGLSGGSWLTSAINQAAMGTAPERGKARFSVLTDAHGVVVRIDVVESNSNMEAWRRVADRALLDLSTKRRPHTLARPIRSLIDVESRVALPSGRSPGMGVSLFNVPLKRREHKDSPNIELLSLKPTLKKVEVLDPSKTGQSLEVPVVSLQLQLLGVNGDLVDLGSVGRQVVHSHVVREDVQ